MFYSHENSFGLLVALDASQSATGFLYFDDSIYEIYGNTVNSNNISIYISIRIRCVSEGFGDDFYYFYALLRVS